jgi:hypothetical protein
MMPKKAEQAITGHVVRAGDLNAPDRERMFGIFTAYYEGVNRDVFLRDLSEKQWVIVLKQDGVIKGFSTQTVLRAELRGKSMAALFSGDTIIDRECWGQAHLASIWTKLAIALADRQKNKEFYWILISKGYRTFRYLPTFFNEYYPRPGVEIPAGMREVMRVFAGAKYPGEYDDAAGIIRAAGKHDRLKAGVADIDGRHMKNRDIMFFAEKNPRWQEGDELVCIARVSRGNFNKAGLRALNSANYNADELKELIGGM